MPSTQPRFAGPPVLANSYYGYGLPGGTYALPGGGYAVPTPLYSYNTGYGYNVSGYGAGFGNYGGYRNYGHGGYGGGYNYRSPRVENTYLRDQIEQISESRPDIDPRALRTVGAALRANPDLGPKAVNNLHRRLYHRFGEDGTEALEAMGLQPSGTLEEKPRSARDGAAVAPGIGAPPAAPGSKLGGFLGLLGGGLLGLTLMNGLTGGIGIIGIAAALVFAVVGSRLGSKGGSAATEWVQSLSQKKTAPSTSVAGTPQQDVAPAPGDMGKALAQFQQSRDTSPAGHDIGGDSEPRAPATPPVKVAAREPSGAGIK